MTKPTDNNGVLVAQAQPNEETVFTSQTPSNSNGSDNGTNYELGMKFQSTKVGQITAIRYWKAASDSGTHTGRIWSLDGTSVLASVTFANETASGWQRQALSSPLTIQANTTYVVTVNCNGYFAIGYYGLQNSVVNGDLSSIADGKNGLYGSPGSFPTNSYATANYFRDVVFVPGVPAAITKVSGDNQTGNAGTALPNPLVVQVNDSNGNPQTGITVTFAVTSSGGGSVSPPSAVTDANGRASTTLTLGTSSLITDVVSATVSGLSPVSFYARPNPTTTNRIREENKNPGNSNWKITNPCTSPNNGTGQGNVEIQGYAAATSVNLGGKLDIKVSLLNDGGQFTIDVYRLGYYGGAGGRLMNTSGLLTGHTQPNITTTDSTTRLLECNWSTSYTINVGNDWTSGLYIAQLTDQKTSRQSQVWFVVRDDSSKSDVLFQSSFTTYIAYNNTGGYSLYDYNSVSPGRAYKVSLDKPLSMATSDIPHYNLITLWERNMLRWMESQGYDISYVTNIDIHSNPQLLRQHKVFLSVGHDEYWSMEQRLAVEQALAAKVNLAFFSSNTAYWRVRFENSNNNSSTGVPNRVMVCYKQAPDPVTTAPTDKFRNINKPENALLGVMYIGDNDSVYNTWQNPLNPSYGGFDFVVQNSTHRYYNNTNLKDGDTLKMLVGFEWDATVGNGSTPNGLTVLSASPVTATTSDPDGATTQNPLSQISNAVAYTAASGAKVFSTGTNQWMWGLDCHRITPAVEDVRVKQITVNVLADMGARPITPDPNIVVP